MDTPRGYYLVVIRTERINLDKLGACASAICAVHCLLTGIALGLLSVAGLGFMGSIWADVAFLGVAVVVGSFAVRHGIRSHHSYGPAAIFALGLLMICLGHFVFRHSHEAGVREDGVSHTLSTVFSVLGGLSLVGFHWLNLRLQKSGGCGCSSCAANAEPR